MKFRNWRIPTEIEQITLGVGTLGASILIIKESITEESI
jgi:hypothetical protein